MTVSWDEINLETQQPSFCFAMLYLFAQQFLEAREVLSYPYFILPKGEAGTTFFYGLSNQQRISCNSLSSCTGDLVWEDGRAFDSTLTPGLASMNHGDIFYAGVIVVDDNKSDDAAGSPTNPLPYLCEFVC